MRLKPLSTVIRGIRYLGGLVPLAYWAVGMASVSMLWALMDLMAHSLHAG